MTDSALADRVSAPAAVRSLGAVPSEQGIVAAGGPPAESGEEAEVPGEPCREHASSGRPGFLVSPFGWACARFRAVPRRSVHRAVPLFTRMAGVWSLLLVTVLVAASDGSVVYYTGFEVEEGYSAASEQVPLRGQLGWVGEGSGGNGLLTNFFEGYGQQAYVGFNAPAPKDELLNIWRPMTVAAPAPGESVLRFLVLMQVVDSTNGEYDDFRWSVYNTAGQRLFTLDFDNSRAQLFYALDDATGFHDTGYSFRNDAIYWLEIYMNFSRNDWIATMNGQVVVDAQPITTANAVLDLSDVDAVWALRTKGAPGDNYLLFDEYTITAEPGATIAPVLESLGVQPTGEFALLLHGERGLRYSVDVSDDFKVWSSLGTNRLDQGVWQFTDTTSTNYPVSFYRAREVGP